ncbi:hypothetical protein K2Z83_09915 [Oscillochloris sp. ZM17-4]|uniref:hypothetical protein n=1 Tax=Oscillochloris sp. ZM17-4 TaxID=2866714 RepID=UPI001C731190|nr:hypothetical protein [Oscillochloris sp. ZM17-4]MBX0327990.1 hypothetical protein [Oscillochloris sp. ZM17-4]
MRRSFDRLSGRDPLALIDHAPLAAEAPPEPWQLRLLIFLGYLALGVVFTWPLALHINDGVIQGAALTWPLALHMNDGMIQEGGLLVDAGQGVWNLWWARTALLRGLNPFTTAYLFYPLPPVDLFFQTLSLPNAIMVAPVLLAIGPVAAFNCVAMLSFGLGGYFTYRIARALVDDRAAALLAGVVFAFTPYHIQRLWSGPMELIAVHWLPLYVLLLMRALARPSLARLLAAALALLVTTLASQYYGLYAAVYTALHGVLAALIAPRRSRLRTLAAAAGVGVFWVVGLAPMLLAVGGIGAAVLEDWYVRQVFHSLALVDLIVPNIQHPLWGAAAAAWQFNLHPYGLETGAGVGLAISLLGLLALIRRPRRAWPWAALALGTVVLAMGPQIHLTAADSPVPGPFLLLDLIGPFRNSSRPSVFLSLTMIPVAALTAEGFASLRDTAPLFAGFWRRSPTSKDSGRGAAIPRTQQRSAVMGEGRIARWGLVVLLAAELVVAPWPITPISVAPIYRQLNADPVPGAVFELPPRNNDSVYLLNQICHGRPLIGGYLARLPDYPLARYPSSLKGLWDAAPPAPDMLDLDPAAELAALGVRYVTLDLTRLPRAQAARLRARLEVPGIRRTYADARMEVYVIDPAAARAVAVLGPGWYDVERDGARHWRWMQRSAGLSLITPAAAMVELQFTATAYAAGRPLEIWRGTQRLTSVDIPAAPYERTLSLRLMLPPGQTDLTLVSPTDISPEGRALSLSVDQLRVTPLPPADGVLPAEAPPLPPTIPAIDAPPCERL